MPYEVDFHPVGNGQNSGDAITLRYHDGVAWRVMVIDGGYQENGPPICAHIKTFYRTNTVDHLVSTHPDDDHIGGLAWVLEEMDVRALWIHRPDQHASGIVGLFKDGRWTADGLTTRLRQTFAAVENLVAAAVARRIPVLEPFQGSLIGPFRVLSPTRGLYKALLSQFRSTPDEDVEYLRQLGVLLPGVGRRVSGPTTVAVEENFLFETLLEGGTTSAENESSLVLYGDLGGGPVLLTADAGLIALRTAITLARAGALPLGPALSLIQVPHHGSRNNVSPLILNLLLGPTFTAAAQPRWGAVVTAGRDDTKHPRRVVINAILRRGWKTQATRGRILCFSDIRPARVGWGLVPQIPFSPLVEAYM